MGDPREKEVNLGQVADKVQFETVRRYIEAGKESGGAPILNEEQKGGNLTVELVVFLNQPENSRIMKEEVFGLVVVINTFKTEEEIIKKANDSALYTNDWQRALRVNKKLESGMVSVNCVSPTGSWDLPFGGWKGSGTGRKRLLESINHFFGDEEYLF